MAEYTISKIKLPNGDICNIKDTWRGIQDNLTSSTNTTESLSAKQGYLLANGSARDDTKVEKTTYEYNREITFGSSGRLCIGKFPCYDSNVTIEIKATTGTTYYAVAILATQNINTTGGGNFTWNTYGDSSNTITPNLYAKYASGSNVIEIYFNPTDWSKNLVHIQCSALRRAPTDVCTSVDSIPSDANRQPTNTLLSISTTGTAANVTGTVATDHGGTGATTPAGARTNLGLGSIATKAETNYVMYGGDDTNLGISSPASTAKTYWADATKIPDNMIKAYYNHSGVEYSLIFSKRSTFGSILKWGYDDRYLRILRIKSGSWQSEDWEKISAGYADSAGSAGSVALSGVTGADDLKAIEALSGTSGFLKKTAANTWSLDTNTYLTSSTGVTSIAGKTGAVTLADLGLSNAMHFAGTTTTVMSDGLATANVTINNATYTPKNGDVVLYSDSEYVWTGSAWERLGRDSSFKTTQTAKSDPTASTTTSTTFIDTISQDANGVITATKKTLPSYVPTSAGVTAVTWDSTNKKLTRTINGSAADVVTIGTIKTALSLVKGDVGLGNVDNTADANKTVKYANMLIGMNSRSSTMAWGNQTGTVITCFASPQGGGWGFRDNNPASGQMSMTIDGTIYIKEGAQDISAAVKSFSVSGQTVTYTNLWGGTGTFTTQDTKNTAGSTNSTSKLFLIGATTQAANPTTNSYQYTYTNNGLLSALKLGLNLNGTEKVHLEWNNTDQSIDFIFE